MIQALGRARCLVAFGANSSVALVSAPSPYLIRNACLDKAGPCLQTRYLYRLNQFIRAWGIGFRIQRASKYLSWQLQGGNIGLGARADLGSRAAGFGLRVYCLSKSVPVMNGVRSFQDRYLGMGFRDWRHWPSRQGIQDVD